MKSCPRRTECRNEDHQSTDYATHFSGRVIHEHRCDELAGVAHSHGVAALLQAPLVLRVNNTHMVARVGFPLRE